jgi:predicted alpha/beta-hydrolase family hydrolase
MRRFEERLEVLGPVRCFDYPYQLAGRRSPDRLPVLVAAHRAALDAVDPGQPVVLIGKSMGGRIGCHLANEPTTRPVLGLVCLGYPLVGQNGSLRDEVLLALRTPILFVQGSRDALCPLDRLAEVRARMRVANQLHVVDGANHSLELTKTMLRASALTQDAVDAAIVRRISDFLEELAGRGG